MSKIESFYADFLTNQDAHSLKRELVPLSRPSAREIEADGITYLNFSSNDYLGLSHHLSLIKRAKEWADQYGAGASASRLVTGNLNIFDAIENKIAAFKKKESALVMVSGFQTNASVLPALFDKKTLGQTPLVFTDKLNHASMHVGCNAAGISQIRYRHNDMTHLEELLEKNKNNDAPKFILTESVFSMDGDIAPLEEIYALAKKYDAFTIIDEAHATGVLGENGSGLAKGADLVIGTFSKAFGAFGAYVACSKTVKEYLINKCSGLIYATALPPAVLGSIDAALDLVPAMNEERAHLQKIAEIVRTEIQNLSFDCGDSETQIIPLIVGDSDVALSFSRTLKENNIWASAIRPPTVPPKSARIRFAFSASHKDNDIDFLIEALKKLSIRKAA